MKLQEARVRADLVYQSLKDHPDVNAVGVGEKVQDGVTTKSYAAIVLVERKGRPRGKSLPATLNTGQGPMPLDIVEAPLGSFHVANSFIDGGDLILNGLQTDKGTLTLTSQKPGQSAFAVTNAHVVADPNSNAVGSSVLSDINGVRTRIGAVVGHSPYRTDRVNRHDVALVRLDPGAQAITTPLMVEAFPGRKITTIGRLNPSPQHASRKAYYYASKASGALELVKLEHVVEIPQFVARDNGSRLVFARVFRLTVTSGQVKAGHSGAAIVRPNGKGSLLLVGLLFAGRGKTAFALSWHDLADALAEFGA